MNRIKFAIPILFFVFLVLFYVISPSVSVDAATNGYYTYTVSDRKVTITDVDTSISGHITIPSNLGGFAVTRIAEDAFSNCTDLISVNVPDSVTSIGSGAFYNCANLQSISLPFIGAYNSTFKSDYSTVFGYIFGFVNYKKNGYTYQYTSIQDYDYYYFIPPSLKSVTVRGHIINNSAFYNCENLESIILLNDVTIIGSHAFYNCTGLKSIDIPASMKTIDEDAFSGCSELEEINIDYNNNYFSSENGVLFNKDRTELIRCPEGLKGTSYVVPNNVNIIQEKAFTNCLGLSSITLADSVTSIGSSAFSGCTGLTCISISDSVTSIGSSAFSGCTGLTCISISDSVTSIGYSAFYNCTSLESITVPENVTSIGNGAFKGCINLESITLPFIGSSRTVSGTYDAVFGYIFGYGSSSTSDATLQYYSSNGSYSYSIPSSLKNVTITDATHIPYGAFYNCSNLESIAMGYGVKDIGFCAFYGCSNLTSITIPESVTSIGNSAFLDCTGLKNIYITDIADWCNISFKGNIYSNPLYYADNLCLNNEPMREIEIPNGVTSIPPFTFRNCTTLESVTIPESVTSIEDSAFYGCTNLTTINYNAVNCSVYSTNFDDCSNIKEITIGNAVEAIPDYIFENFKNVKDIILPNSVKAIGEGAFLGCSNIENIVIPDSVTHIGYYAFEDCTSLKNVTIGSGVSAIGDYAFGNCYNLESVYINDMDAWCNIEFYKSYYNGSDTANPLVYADNLYLNNKLVTNVIIPDGVTEISKYAFSFSSLTSITIPDSVTKIKEDAFEGTNNLWHILYTGTIDEWNSIDIDSWGNYNLYSATKHYNANGDEVTCEYEPATCAKKGYKKAECSICKMNLYEEYGSPKHTYDNICDITCNVCGGVTYEFNHDYDYCFKNYSESLGEYGDWKLTPSQSGVYKINPDSNSKKGFSPHYITVVGPDNNIITFNNESKGWPLIKGFEYTIKLRYDYTDGNYSDIVWSLENTGATLFPDAANSQWYSDAIAYAYGTGIMKGYANGLFGTSDGIQRQDFLVMLARYDGVNLDEYSYASNIFSDVAQGSYYQAAVNWGYRHGIVTGYNDGRFGVGDMITREQIVTFLYRYAKYKNIDVENATDTKAKAFPDYNKVTDFAEAPIIWAIDKGVINGKSGYIAPQGNAQRCEIAQIMYNIFKNDIF